MNVRSVCAQIGWKRAISSGKGQCGFPRHEHTLHLPEKQRAFTADDVRLRWESDALLARQARYVNTPGQKRGYLL